MTAPLDEWTIISIGDVDLVTCPTCGALLNHHDTMALARHVVWHDRRHEWAWEDERARGTATDGEEQ